MNSEESKHSASDGIQVQVEEEPYDMRKLNMEFLRRLHLYKEGKLYVEEEKVLNGKNQLVLRTFDDLPAFIPFKVRSDQSPSYTIHEDELLNESQVLTHERLASVQKSIAGPHLEDIFERPSQPQFPQSQDLRSRTVKPKVSSNKLMLKPCQKLELQDLNLKEKDDQEFLIEHVDRIIPQQMIHMKPLAIIYNPNSGRKRNIRPLIEQRFQQAGLQFEFLATQRAFQTYEYAASIDLDKYSALAVVGGDGSVHEVINGMLARKDGKKVPIGLLPNGSGNDTGKNFYINNLEKALDYIIKGDTLKIDTVEVIADYKTKKAVPEIEFIHKYRHMIANMSLSVPAKIVHSANYYKKCCGGLSYTVGALCHLCRFREEQYAIYVDGVAYSDGFRTAMISGQNGKFCGGGMNLNPFAIINDGYVDLTIAARQFSKREFISAMGQTKKGATQAYMDGLHHVRGKSFMIFNLNEPKRGQSERPRQLFDLDGEEMVFQNFLVLNTVQDNVEILVDYNQMLQESKFFQ